MAGIVLLAAGGTAAYLIAQPAVARRPAPLPSRVLSFQAVGLVTQQPSAGSAPGRLLQLLGQRDVPRFSVLTPELAAAGSPQWTADLMAGQTYIFIFLPTGGCLTATGPAARPGVALRRCDLSASQRWRRASPPVLALGHDFYQYANLRETDCLTQADPASGQHDDATLAGCSVSRPAGQLIALW